jgi:hypothetical protein
MKTKKKVPAKAVRIGHVSLSDLLIIRDTVKKCGGYDRFKSIVIAYSKIFGKPPSRKTKK